MLLIKNVTIATNTNDKTIIIPITFISLIQAYFISALLNELYPITTDITSITALAKTQFLK